MTRGRAVAVGCLVTLAVLLQVTVASRLPLPGGRPALLVLVVAGVAASHGPTAGMLAGLAGGLLADVAPPSNHPIGSSVLVLVAVGELIGLLSPRPPGRVRAVALVGVATGLAGLGMAGLGVLLGHPLPSAAALFPSLAAAIGYNMVLAPAVLRLIGGVGERAEVTARGRPGRAAVAAGRGGRRGRQRGRYRGATAGGLR